MGCWNETCFLSNLSIYGGDPVVGFLVAVHHYADQNPYLGSCYSTDAGSPFGLPFVGEYDDYGSMDEIDFNSIAALCNKHVLDVDDFGECLSSIERAACSPRNGLVEVVLRRYSDIDWDENGKQHIVTPNPTPVTLIMCLKDIMDALIKEDGVDIERRKQEMLSGLKETEGLYKHGSNLKIKNYMLPNLLNLRCSPTEGDDYGNMIDFVLENHPDRVDELLEGLITEQTMRSIMMKLRKSWMGTTGKGSQSSFRRTHLVLAEAVKKHILNSFDGPEDAYGVLLGERDW